MFDENRCVILDDNGTVMGSGKFNGKLFSLDSISMEESMHEAQMLLMKAL